MSVRQLLETTKGRNRRRFIDTVTKAIFRLCGLLSALMICIICIFIIKRGVQVFLPGYEFGQLNLWDFLTGLLWRQDQQQYGVLFIFINTLSSAFLAALIAFPLSILSALFIAKIAPKQLRGLFTTIVELLAAIPSIVYGVFAAGVLVNGVDWFAKLLGYTTRGGNSMLTVVILLAIMIYPTITSLSITAIEAVPHEIEEGSLALGASRTQTNFRVVITSARSGIFAGLILGLGRAFGEATAVSMVAGNALIGPTTNLFDITRTLTTTMLAGLKETSGVDYDVRFSVGIILMITIIVTNLIINLVKNRIGSGKNDA